MSTNGIEKIHNVWPLIVGEFFNHEHILIKDELINFFKEYEKKLPEGNEQLRDKNYVGNYDLYQSKYNLLAENENNKILKEVFKFIAKSILTMSKKANAEEGKLLVWPNFLYHGSHPYQGNKDRIIISANSTIDLL